MAEADVLCNICKAACPASYVHQVYTDGVCPACIASQEEEKWVLPTHVCPECKCKFFNEEALHHHQDVGGCQDSSEPDDE